MAKLDEKSLKVYKEALLKLRSILSREIEHIKGDTLLSTKDSAGDLSGYSLHMADQASDNYDREFLLSLADNERESLGKIEDALLRIEEKTYGICAGCEKPILKARLKAVPFVDNCVPCQEAIEKQAKSK
ncbi:MAG: DnaK suppressor protein [Candidatus Omnitrophota bacterium]|jgi:DnaK suppressor protein